MGVAGPINHRHMGTGSGAKVTMTDDQAAILFVDDEPAILDGLRRAFHVRGVPWRLLFETSPSEALKRIERETFDVLVTDLRMPGLTGLDLLKATRRNANAPIGIVLTGTADLETAAQAINEAQVFRFYTKPCPIEQLHQGILAGIAEKRRDRRASPPGLALDLLPLGVLALDRDLRVVYTNRAGAAILAARDGLTVDAKGVCRALDVSASQLLHDHVRRLLNANQAGTAAVALPRDDEKRPLAVVVTVNDGGDDDPTPVLFARDPERHPAPRPDMVQRLFGLTPAEARLAISLARGCDLNEATSEHSLTLSSARTYLKNIFSKTGTNRQAELVRLLLTSLFVA